jgi:hypothetical protein
VSATQEELLRGMGERATGLDLRSAEDRALFRGSVADLFGMTARWVLLEHAAALGVELPQNASSRHCYRTLADAYIREVKS